MARRGCKLLLDQFASTAADDRALQHLQGRGRGLRPQVRSDGCRRLRAPSMWRRTPRTRPRRSRRGSPTSSGWRKLAQTPGRQQQVQHAVVRPHARRRGRERDVRHAGRDRRRSSTRLRAAGVEHVLLNGPAGSRENLRAFAREVMPAFAGPAPAPTARSSRGSRTSLVHKPVPRAFGGIPPLIKRNTAAVRAVAVLRRRGHAARLRHRPADGHRGDRLGEPCRAHGRAVRHQPLPGVLSGRQDHRHTTAASPASCSGRAWRMIGTHRDRLRDAGAAAPSG